MKICVLSNSHAASLKSGWDAMRSRFPGVDLTFFAARARNLGGLVLEENRLVPSSRQLAKFLAYTSGGKEQVIPSEYDACLVYGLDFILPLMDPRLSSAVKRDCCRDSFTSTLSFGIAGMVRAACSVPIYIGHNPQPAYGERLDKFGPRTEYAQVIGILDTLKDIDGAVFVSQPADTLDRGWATRVEYSQGSTRLDIGGSSAEAHPSDDIRHMNGNFGEKYLEKFFRQVTGA